MQASHVYEAMRVEELLVSAGLRGASIALCTACVAMLLVLANWLVALVAIVHVGAVCVCSIATFVWMGWPLGFIEALCIIVVIGFSVDFIAHVGIAFATSQAAGRYERTAQALGELGISVLSGATSTTIIAAFMTQCEMVPFRKVGIFMLVAISFSTGFALLVLPTVLAVVGPSGSTGKLSYSRLRSSLRGAQLALARM